MQVDFTKSNKSFFLSIMVDASPVGVGTIVILADDKGRIQVVSYFSRVFTEKENFGDLRRIYCHCLCIRLL